MIEAGVVLNLEGQPLYWHLPESRTNVLLPDSKSLWDILWDNRDNISGFAHSHPGKGTPTPSHTDLTTFDGIEKALGKNLDWFITSEDRMIFIRWGGPETLDYVQLDINQHPSWVKTLKQHSNIGE